MELPKMKIALDTNTLIYFLEGIEPHAGKVETILDTFLKGKNEGLISTITVAEILTGFYLEKDSKGALEIKKQLEALSLTGFKIVPVTVEIADMAANLRAERGGRLPDALIIATALNQAADIVYSEDKDLQRFSKDITICQLP
jgi:predicted nucleic acid-binding protein